MPNANFYEKALFVKNAARYNLPDLQYLVTNCSKQISRVSSLGSGTRRYV